MSLLCRLLFNVTFQCLATASSAQLIPPPPPPQYFRSPGEDCTGQYAGHSRKPLPQPGSQGLYSSSLPHASASLAGTYAYPAGPYPAGAYYAGALAPAVLRPLTYAHPFLGEGQVYQKDGSLPGPMSGVNVLNDEHSPGWTYRR
jgi:hypothetical protein